MPRILRIFNRLILGGPAFNVTFLTKFLEPEFETKLIIGAKEEHEQEATFLKEQYQIAPVEVPNMKRPINFSDDWKAYKDIKKIIQDYKPHIVHTHAAKPGAIGRLAASACKVPIILHTFHGHVFHSYFGKTKSQLFVQAERYLASKTDRIIAISDIQKNELANQFKICHEQKIAVVPLGIDLQKFYEHRDEKRQAFRLKYGINENEIAIGIIGRIVGVKNHAMFLSAIKQVLQSTQKQIRVIIVGDGDLRNDLMHQLNEAKISYNYFPDNQKPGIVTFTSWLTNMDEVYAGIDIMALSSFNEGTPVSLIEAQASNKPIVSTDVGGVRDVVIQNKTAFVTPSNDVDSFSSALLQLTENDELRHAMGKDGKDFVFSRYDKSRLVNDMRAVYHQLLLEKKVEV